MLTWPDSALGPPPPLLTGIALFVSMPFLFAALNCPWMWLIALWGRLVFDVIFSRTKRAEVKGLE
jgi:hypothetical protein